MLLTNTNLTEDATIAEELMQTDELIRKCKVVKMAVQDGDFTLEQALNIYKVSKEDYLAFTAKTLITSIQESVSTEPLKTRSTDSIFIFEIIYKSIVGKADPSFPKMIRHLKKLSKDIEEDKIKLLA